MIFDMGYVSTVMVKDLSRLGRDYVSVGYYTDNYFPQHDIRFIAVNDMVDSEDGENEIAPFKNIMNEFYARDISKKVRSANRIRGNLGEPLSQPPYGYMKDPNDKRHWIVDPEASQIVKRIFLMAIEGNGNETIARLLQEDKVLNPTAYWQSKGIGRGGKKTQPNPYKWGKTTVEKIKQYEWELAEWKQQVEGKPAEEKKPPERKSVLEKLHRIRDEAQKPPKRSYRDRDER